MDNHNLLNIAEDIAKIAKSQKAEIVEIISRKSSGIKITQRLNKVEKIQDSNSVEFGIKIIMGKKSASTYFSGKYNKESISKAIERTVSMCQLSPNDNDLIYATKENWSSYNEIKLKDNKELSIEQMKDYISKVENKAMKQKNIVNSNGASITQNKSDYALYSSLGFAKEFATSIFSSSISVIAEQNNHKEVDYAYTMSRFLNNLDNPENIGLEAGKRAGDRLGAKKIKTEEMPIIFDKRVTPILLDSFASAVNGENIVKNTSFLLKKFGQNIFKNNINIIDNPLLENGLSSQPFDGEGLACKKLNLVENGKLVNWLLDLRSAKKLNLKSNANAVRSIRNNICPSYSNLYLENGNITKDDLISGIKKGIYVVELSGQGINIVNGDYSQGAFAFMIENGKITHPVNEITIAGNFIDMFKKLIPANDLEFKYEINTPTLMIEKMMVGGS